MAPERENVSRRASRRIGITKVPTLAPLKASPVARDLHFLKYIPTITNPLPKKQALARPKN